MHQSYLTEESALAAHVAARDDLECAGQARVGITETQRNVCQSPRCLEGRALRDSLWHERTIAHAELLVKRVPARFDRERFRQLGSD